MLQAVLLRPVVGVRWSFFLLRGVMVLRSRTPGEFSRGGELEGTEGSGEPIASPLRQALDGGGLPRRRRVAPTSISMPSARPGLSVAAVAVTVHLLVFAHGARLPPLPMEAGVSAEAAGDYSKDPFLVLRRLAASFVSSTLGNLLAEAPATSPDEGNHTVRTSSGVDLRGEPTPSPSPFIGSVLPSPDWDLEPSVYADRTTARPGDDIIYTVIVRNVGRADFDGQVQIEAHTPFGTTFQNFEPPPCEGQGPPDCIFVPQPVPGPPNEANIHAPSDRRPYTIPSGGSAILRYRVSVDPGVPPGTKLPNHAHATTTTPPRSRTSETVVVVVG